MPMSMPCIRHVRVLLALPLAVALSACDMLGIETPGMANAKKEAEGRAIGAACRHAVRSLEDCYGANPRISKAAIFEGWREMDAYMRDNEIEGMPAPPPPPPAPAAAGPEEVILPPATPTTTPATSTAPATSAGQAAPTGAIALPPRPNIAPAR